MVIRDGKVLMVKHRSGRREYWTLPGGALEPGESFEEAAVREMREETGLSVRVLRLLFVGTYGDDASPEKCFLLEPLDDAQEARLGVDPEQAELSPGRRELQGIRWFALEEMRDDIQVRQVIAALGLDAGHREVR